MLTTIKELLFTLLPAFNDLVVMQKSGLVILTDKVNWPLARNYSSLASINKKFEKHKLKEMDSRIRKDDKGNFKQVVKNEKNQPAVSAYDWIKPGDEEKYNDELNRYIGESIDWTPFKTSLEDVKRIGNFPMDVFSVFEAFEMFTELNLNTNIKAIK